MKKKIIVVIICVCLLAIICANIIFSGSENESQLVPSEKDKILMWIKQDLPYIFMTILGVVLLKYIIKLMYKKKVE